MPLVVSTLTIDNCGLMIYGILLILPVSQLTGKGSRKNDLNMRCQNVKSYFYANPKS